MAKITTIISSSSKDTIQLGMDLSLKLKKGSVIAFFGDLAAGKTTLIKGIVKGLSNNTITNAYSPTFVYLNIYHNLKLPVYHFDLYRIKNKNQFFDMGFDEYFHSDGICLIEWAERIEDILPKNTIKLEIKHLKENQRELNIYDFTK